MSAPVMQGTLTIPFSDLFRDTVGRHGIAWACRYYTRRGMAPWEFDFWLRAINWRNAL